MQNEEIIWRMNVDHTGSSVRIFGTCCAELQSVFFELCMNCSKRGMQFKR